MEKDCKNIKDCSIKKGIITEEEITDQEPFYAALTSLINRFSKEDESNTPDHILAFYLQDCLRAFNMATQQRETYYGRDGRPTKTKTIKFKIEGE